MKNKKQGLYFALMLSGTICLTRAIVATLDNVPIAKTILLFVVSFAILAAAFGVKRKYKIKVEKPWTSD